MRARSSATIFGGRCRKRQRWCRESRSGWIFCARGAREVLAEMSRASSKKKNFLFRKRKSENRNWHMGAAVAAPFFFRAAHSMRDAGTSADPATAEDDIAVIEDGGLAGGDGALRGVEGNARGSGIERFDGGRRGFMLVADFGEDAKRAGRLLTRNPIHTLNFARRFPKNLILTDDDAVLFRVNRENVDGLASGEAKALALADCKVVNSVVAPNYVAVFVDDFTFAILQRDSALT